MCTLPPGGASAIRQIRAAGIQTPILANVGMTDDYWISATPDLSNFYNPTMMSIFGDDPSPKVQEFVAAYTKKYGTRVPQAYASVGYLVIQAWSTAVKRAGTTDAKAVVAELEKFKDEDLLLGPTTFTSRTAYPDAPAAPGHGGAGRQASFDRTLPQRNDTGHGFAFPCRQVSVIPVADAGRSRTVRLAIIPVSVWQGDRFPAGSRGCGESW